MHTKDNELADGYFTLPAVKEVAHSRSPGETKSHLGQCRSKLHVCLFIHERDIVLQINLHLQNYKKFLTVACTSDLHKAVPVSKPTPFSQQTL
jgi:hypothetical protein